MSSSKLKPITTEDFVLAIAVSCPFQMLYHHYISDLVNASPKGKNDTWIAFCKSLQGSDEPVKRSWRVWVHKIFVKNIHQIELEFWQRSYYISDPANSFKILGYLEEAMTTTKLTEQEIKSTKKYLREISGVECEKSCSDDGSSDSKKISSGEEIIEVVKVNEECKVELDDLYAQGSQDSGPGSADGTKGKKSANVANANLEGGENTIRPIDPAQIGPLRVNQIITCLYRATGLALANEEEEDIVAAMKNLSTRESEDVSITAKLPKIQGHRTETTIYRMLVSPENPD
ncbi:hypothetical protein KQX54_013987 [Cotesia glomerata]|uniref:Uncharacterized protein n=1 Tax=Cotesia glomerata TaxID=32391 RepID=A0AAV7IWK3_COTGL|nr:hypothetical protein KQX54_013987 [Cotesia glomerata]